MTDFVNHKLVETQDASISDEGGKVCDLEITDTGIFLKVKLYCGKSRKRHRIARICLADLLFQVAQKLDRSMQERLRNQLTAILDTK
jgi:hypothetical protein